MIWILSRFSISIQIRLAYCRLGIKPNRLTALAFEGRSQAMCFSSKTADFDYWISRAEPASMVGARTVIAEKVPSRLNENLSKNVVLPVKLGIVSLAPSFSPFPL